MNYKWHSNIKDVKIGEKEYHKLGSVLHACNLSYLEDEVGGS
jgi:hypothetical protein